MTNKLPSFLKSSNSQRGQSGKNDLSDSYSQFLLYDPPSTIPSLTYLTFLKTMGSSSHTGLMALLFWEVLVFSAFLLVSAGRPNISISTYTPTRRSVRNWPEITCDTEEQRQKKDMHIWQHFRSIHIYMVFWKCLALV